MTKQHLDQLGVSYMTFYLSKFIVVLLILLLDEGVRKVQKFKKIFVF